MFRRILSLVLVPLMLANQGLCFAHSHQGTDFAEPEDHGSHRHFHVGVSVGHHPTHSHDHGADHPHGDHSRQIPEPDKGDFALVQVHSPIGEHDADALCFAESLPLVGHQGSKGIVAERDIAPAAQFLAADLREEPLRLGPRDGQRCSVFDGVCPIYLRTLSLRI